MDNKINAAVTMAIALALGAWFLLPLTGSYQLKTGHAVFPIKDGVVAWRGARLFGPMATGAVISGKGCQLTSAPLRVLRRSTMFDLPYRVSLGGRVMYADHDALEKI
jgi:hypothetical protein